MYGLVSVVGTLVVGTALLGSAVSEDIPLQSTGEISCVQKVSISKASVSPPVRKVKPVAQKPKLAKNIIAPTEVENMITGHAAQYGVDPNLMKKIAKCESTFNANAVNGSHAGMYQFKDSTWVSTRRAMGLDTNPQLRFDANEATKTAAFKIAHGGKQAWQQCL
jgi:hypothetical protein